MKCLNQFITEYIIKKKLDKPIDSEDHYEYYPKTKKELIKILNELTLQNIYDFNCIDTSAITDMSHLFDDYLYDNILNKNFDVSGWNVKNVKDMNSTFNGCKNFDCDLSCWDVSNVENMEFMFNYCTSFKGNGLENWNVSNVKRTDMMFNNCAKFSGKSIENWNVSNVLEARNMFCRCENFDCDLSNWHIVSN